MFGWRRAALGRQIFRCAYCRGHVRADRARIAVVRGQTAYVHLWHPKRPGE
jgi:hypothetical protein